MFVKFPDLDTLRLALTSGAIPTDVVQKAAVAGFGEQDQLWVETPAKLPAAAQKELKRLGALVCKASDASLSIEVSSWLELLPLVPDNSPFDTLEQTPVLFEVPGHAELSRLVVEMLRLGNDRQSFRWLEESSDKNGDGGRALLRGRSTLLLTVARYRSARWPRCRAACVCRTRSGRVGGVGARSSAGGQHPAAQGQATAAASAA